MLFGINKAERLRGCNAARLNVKPGMSESQIAWGDKLDHIIA